MDAATPRDESSDQLADAAGPQRVADLVREHAVVGWCGDADGEHLLTLRNTTPLQHRDSPLVEIDRPAAALRLSAHRFSPPRRGTSPRLGPSPSIERGRLSHRGATNSPAAHAGHRSDVHHRAGSVAVGEREEATQLVGRPHRHVRRTITRVAERRAWRGGSTWRMTSPLRRASSAACRVACGRDAQPPSTTAGHRRHPTSTARRRACHPSGATREILVPQNAEFSSIENDGSPSIRPVVAPLAGIEPATHGLRKPRCTSDWCWRVRQVRWNKGFAASAVREVPESPGSSASFATQTLPTRRARRAACPPGRGNLTGRSRSSGPNTIS
jgi:hypothetical protein